MQTIVTSNYTYTGTVIDSVPHIYGTFAFNNSHRYIGNIAFGIPNKYGTYLYQNSYYQGFFSRGKFHGLGTFEDSTNIYKGYWLNGKKNGVFKRTHKPSNTSYIQKYKNDKLVKETITNYIPVINLKTTEEKAPLTPNGKCIICYTMDKDCCNAACGHIVCCTICLQKCLNCPLCRIPITDIVHVYYS